MSPSVDRAIKACVRYRDYTDEDLFPGVQAAYESVIEARAPGGKAKQVGCFIGSGPPLPLYRTLHSKTYISIEDTIATRWFLVDFVEHVTDASQTLFVVDFLTTTADPASPQCRWFTLAGKPISDGEKAAAVQQHFDVEIDRLVA